MTFQIYSDESKHSTGRFRAISALSGRKEYLDKLRRNLLYELERVEVSEAKWDGVKSYPPKIIIAKRFIDRIFDYIINNEVRIDTIIWDTYDSRHNIVGRDDVKNFHIMYYNLLRHIGRIQREVNWEFYPDQQSMVDWQKIKRYLNNTYLEKPYIVHLFGKSGMRFNFIKIEEQESIKEPLVQICDLFAGMARFSREKRDKYCYWKNYFCNKTVSLFPEIRSDINLSKGEKTRFSIIDDFCTRCKENRLGVSIENNHYLKTPDPASPINFWHYTPQHENDRAPTS